MRGWEARIICPAGRHRSLGAVIYYPGSDSPRPAPAATRRRTPTSTLYSSNRRSSIVGRTLPGRKVCGLSRAAGEQLATSALLQLYLVIGCEMRTALSVPICRDRAGQRGGTIPRVVRKRCQPVAARFLSACEERGRCSRRRKRKRAHTCYAIRSAWRRGHWTAGLWIEVYTHTP